MGFELWDGQATWDYAGKSITPPPTLPTVTITASDAAAAETGPDFATFTFARTGDTSSALTVDYTLDGFAQNGSDYQPLASSVTIPEGLSSAALTVTPIDDTVTEGNETVILTLSSNAAYTIGSPDHATVTIVDNEQPPSIDIVWVDDVVPVGAVTRADGGDNPDWQWVTDNPAPFFGTRAHQSSLANGDHWHLFIGTTATLSVQAGDVLFTYIYIDPAHVPTAILLEWYGDSFEHRAYWGANKFSWGTDGTASRRFIGPIPNAGQWVRLEVPASLVGLEGQTLSGMGFELWDGQATWDHAGKSITPPPPPPPPSLPGKQLRH
jgi:hypothetical protein